MSAGSDLFTAASCVFTTHINWFTTQRKCFTTHMWHQLFHNKDQALHNIDRLVHNTDQPFHSKHQPFHYTDQLIHNTTYLHNLISYHQSSRLLRSSSQFLLHVPRKKPTLDSCAAPQIWNHISTAIRVPSLDSFKRHLTSPLPCHNSHHLATPPTPLIYFFELWCITKFLTLHFKTEQPFHTRDQVFHNT